MKKALREKKTQTEIGVGTACARETANPLVLLPFTKASQFRSPSQMQLHHPHSLLAHVTRTVPRAATAGEEEQ